jgi:protein-L-isoaspartate(D-aspartate) O-methyltransferase
MFPPKVEAHALQALAMKKHENVLEVGTGSGYMAALLGAHADHVWSMEIDPQLAETARANLRAPGSAMSWSRSATAWPASPHMHLTMR